MRKLMLVVGLVCLCATVALSQNEGKVSNGWSCSKPEQMNSIDVGDQPGHAYAIEQIKCTSTKGEYAGVKEKEGTGTEFVEVAGNKSSGQGVFVETFANGDKATFTYQFTGAMADGKMQSGTNKWQATSGTGKFKGMKASGTCKATGNPDGSTSFNGGQVQNISGSGLPTGRATRTMETWFKTSFTGTPACAAARWQSSNSGCALYTRPARPPTFTPTAP